MQRVTFAVVHYVRDKLKVHSNVKLVRQLSFKVRVLTKTYLCFIEWCICCIISYEIDCPRLVSVVCTQERVGSSIIDI